MADWAESVLELYFLTRHQRFDPMLTIDFQLQNKPSEGELQSLIIHEVSPIYPTNVRSEIHA